MVVEIKNIFADLPQQIGAEDFFRLFQSGSTNVERIVSRSHCSPPDFWYDEPEDEWVIVLRGHATLDFEKGESVELETGDYLTIPRLLLDRLKQRRSFEAQPIARKPLEFSAHPALLSVRSFFGAMTDWRAPLNGLARMRKG